MWLDDSSNIPDGRLNSPYKFVRHHITRSHLKVSILYSSFILRGTFQLYYITRKRRSFYDCDSHILAPLSRQRDVDDDTLGIIQGVGENASEREETIPFTWACNRVPRWKIYQVHNIRDEDNRKYVHGVSCIVIQSSFLRIVLPSLSGSHGRSTNLRNCIIFRIINRVQIEE